MLELREYETVTVQLTPTQAAELAQHTRGAVTDIVAPRVINQVTPSKQPGSYDVQAGPFVGRFTLPSGMTVDIASRFYFTDLIEILRVAARQPVLLRETPTPAQAGHGLLELITMAFIREMRRIVGFGLAKGYISRRFTRPPYPGTPDATAHLAKHLGRPDRLITRAQRLMVDIPINQVLAAAHRVLRYQTYSDPSLPVRLRSLAPVLTGISEVPDPLRLVAAAGRNLPTRYRHAFSLAVLILLGRTTLPSGSTTAGVSVLFNMTKVWESYVQALLEPTLPPGHRFSAQHPVPLTSDTSNITAAADLVELGADLVPVKVFDAKYKPWGAKPSANEIYQVVTYAYRLGLTTAVLVYPGRGEQTEVAVGEYRVHALGLPVLTPRVRQPIDPSQQAEAPTPIGLNWASSRTAWASSQASNRPAQ